ncbi:MAG: hypothetical protein E5W94_05350 [Mesorhizobium sp.]|nr:MAG: hypothetical protein E5W94_05350 [Mesorhizobium sp.]
MAESVGDGNSSYLQELRKIQAEDRQFQTDMIKFKSHQDKFAAVFQALLASSAQVANSGR